MNWLGMRFYKLSGVLLCAMLFSTGCAKQQKHAIEILNKYIDVDTEVVPLAVEDEKGNADRSIVTELKMQNSGLLADVDLSKNKKGMSSTAYKKKSGEKTQFVELSFKGVSLKELVQLFFDEYLDKPYTILEGFKDKKVNFVFKGQVSQSGMVDVFKVFFGFHGVVLKSSHGVYAVSSDEASVSRIVSMGTAGDTFAVFKCRYVNSRDFLVLSRLFLVDDKSATSVNDANSVVVKASQVELDAIAELLKQIDVPYFNDKSLLVYGPKFVSVAALKVLVEKYEHLLGSTAKHPKKRIEVESLAESGRLVMVVSDREAKQLLLQFLASVDQPGRNIRELFQYPLSNQIANDVLPTVKNLFKAVSKSGEIIDVVADKLTNSLYIMATADDYVELKKILRTLDYRIPAVHIDVLVAEVSLTDDLQYGVEWFLKKELGGTLTDMAFDASDAALLASGSGAALGVLSLSDDKFVSMQLLAKESDFSVLSNPHLLVKNGATAMINVGQDIPIPTSTTTTNTAGQSSQTDFLRENVTINLEVTPQISMDGVIQLDVKLKDKRLAGFETDGGSRQPIFSVRELNTNLVLEDNQTVLLGGIIQRNMTEEVSKLPLLGDIPYLGVLFSSLTTKDESTELFLLITPKLVVDASAAEMLTRALLKSKSILKFDQVNTLFPLPDF